MSVSEIVIVGLDLTGVSTEASAQTYVMVFSGQLVMWGEEPL